MLSFSPRLPRQWDGYSFKVIYRGRIVHVNVTKSGTDVSLESGEPLAVNVDGKQRTIN
ncbi:MAG: hypothetical protein LUD76_09920 [Alistipes sp.]|nr:hypothetical protein [Alistipes sp.]